MNHKRGRAKNRRAGCLMCKPWKMNGAKRTIAGPSGRRHANRQVERADASAGEQTEQGAEPWVHPYEDDWIGCNCDFCRPEPYDAYAPPPVRFTFEDVVRVR